jgi:hypothetical protein
MALLFVFGMMVFFAGLTRLALRVVHWSIEVSGGHHRGPEQWHPTAVVDIPDTVPSAWVEAYRADQEG